MHTYTMYIYIHENDIFYFKSDKHHKSMTVLATNIGKEKKNLNSVFKNL